MSKIKIGAQVTAKVRPTKVTVSGTFQGYRLEDQEDPTSICGTVLHVKDGMQHLDYVYVDSIKVCESEDERIRKRIINILGNNTDAREEGWAVYANEIAWLEKPKEQKESVEEVLIKAGLKPYKDGNQWCILIGDNIQEGICGFGDTIDDALYHLLREAIAYQKEQKPAEWNLTDADFINEIDETLFMAEAGRNEVVKNQIERERNWINSLPERFNLQTKQEWSKEDEKMLDAIIHDVMTLHNAKNLEELKNKVNWLKSLRPQPHWKPSEEEMEALMRAITWLVENGNHTVSSTLADLRSNLQKLM